MHVLQLREAIVFRVEYVHLAMHVVSGSYLLQV